MNQATPVWFSFCETRPNVTLAGFKRTIYLWITLNLFSPCLIWSTMSRLCSSSLSGTWLCRTPESHLPLPHIHKCTGIKRHLPPHPDFELLILLYTGNLEVASLTSFSSSAHVFLRLCALFPYTHIQITVHFVPQNIFNRYPEAWQNSKEKECG